MEAQVDYVDPNTGQFSNQAIGQGFGGTGFNINNKRPYWHKGKVYVNQVTGFDPATKTPIMKAQQVTANATLMRDEWIEIDTIVQKIARERLVGIADLRSRGLTYNLTNAMGKTVLEYQDMNDPGEASMDMDAANTGRNDRPDFLTKYLPIPIIYANFSISDRSLQASRNSGDPLDTIMVEAATRRVVEKSEDLLFTDTSFTYGGGTIYSYVSATNKNTVSLATNWDASAKTGAGIKDDVQSMISASITAKHFGPWVMYIPTAYQIVMGDDYTTGYPKTIKQRLMEIDGISDIKVADRLPANTVVMVEMTTGTIRLINGFEPTVIQWEGNGGLTHHFKVMTIQVPQIRADQDGNSGLTVLS